MISHNVVEEENKPLKLEVRLLRWRSVFRLKKGLLERCKENPSCRRYFWEEIEVNGKKERRTEMKMEMSEKRGITAVDHVAESFWLTKIPKKRGARILVEVKKEAKKNWEDISYLTS